MKPLARLPSLTVAALLTAAPMASPALASYFGSITLKPGEVQQIYTGLPGFNMRLCNDFFSTGAATVTVDDNTPHELLPGLCTEDIGNRIVVQSHASGKVTIVYRSIRDQQNHHMQEDE